MRNPTAIPLLLLGVMYMAGGEAAKAQLTQTVKGKVLDAESRFPLWGASVLLKHDSLFIGATTDSAGTFTLKQIPLGRQSFIVSYIGYETKPVNEVIVGSAKEVVLEVDLTEKLTDLKEVRITASKDQPLNSMAMVSAKVFSTEETSRYAGSFEDPGRMAASFAGVSNDGDFSNELVIRGNSSRGVLWRLEGIDIPNPNHFSSGEGASGGGISILSSNVLANSDFFTGAFPAEYGNATAGIFDMKLRKGNTGKREYTALVGVLGTEIGLEGPLFKEQESSYLLHYRYSTLDIFNSLGVDIAGDVVPNYQDLAFNLFTKTKKFGTFSLFGIGGYSEAEISVLKDSTKWKGFSDQQHETVQQMIGAAGLTHTYLLKDQKTYIRTVISASLSSSRYSESYFDYDYEDHLLYREKFEYPGWRASVLGNTKLNSKNTIRTGAVYSALYYALFRENYNAGTDMMDILLQNTGNTGLAEAYLQWKRRLGANFNINTGVHYTHFLLNGRQSLEPRLGATLKLDHNRSLNMGLGLHSKVEAVSIYMAESVQQGAVMRPNENLDLMKSFHAVLGYNQTLPGNVNLKAEAYYQFLFDVPVFDSLSHISALNFGSGYTDVQLYNAGTGTNYGIELTAERYFSKNYFFMVTGSLFDSRYIAGDHIERNTVYNANFVTNFIGGKEFVLGKSKQHVLGLNARAIWKGGNRKIPIDLAASKSAGEAVYDIERAYDSRLPDYFRIDMGLSYRINKPRMAWILSVDIQNVINRANVYYEYYDSDKLETGYVYQMGIIPVLKVKIAF